METICCVCKKRKKGKDLNIIYYIDIESNKNNSCFSSEEIKFICDKCRKNLGDKDTINYCKSTTNVTYKDLEDLDLIKKFKGRIERV